LGEELAGPEDHLSDAAKNLLKFHGSYQQEDRDARKNRAKTGVTKAYMFMVRLKLPGGRLTADQYIALDEIAGRHANGTLRFTTRQSIQFHGILKTNLKQTIADINAALVSTLGACGDVNRNVVACPAPLGDPVRKQMNELADRVAAHLAPKAGGQAYHEIWLNGEKVSPDGDPAVAEPIYGKVYLPRKFKTAFALPHDNCTDVLANCLGFLAVAENGHPVGYDMYVGGGQGMTHGKKETFPYLAKAVAFVSPEEVVSAAEAVVKLFRDHGNRADRKRARLKYLMADWGVEKFRDVFAKSYFQKTLLAPRGLPITGLDLHHGWHPQGNGKWFLGLSVENGRVKDEGAFRLRTGLRTIVSKYRCAVRITPQQDVLVCDVAVADKAGVDSLLNEHGIPRPENLSLVRKWGMACPAIPTCPLALTESERVLPEIIDHLETTLAGLDLAGEPISVRMTGCPNGCARPYQSEIGLVGRSGEKFTVFIGGDSFGRRMNVELKDLVPKGEIVPLLGKVFAAFKAGRAGTESFGDFCDRVGIETLRGLVHG
jgi:sulfite reductase (ferredoxin)